MRYIETHITDHCNLNCKGCSHFAGLSEPYFKDIKEYEDELKRLSKIRIDTFRVLGGEPLLHPDYFAFCELTKRYFPNADVVLVTNGILLKPKMEEALTAIGVRVCTSDYGLWVYKSREIHNKLKMYNISLDLEGTQDINTAFENCDLHQNEWYFLKDGRIYTCAIMANIDIFNKRFGNPIKYDLDDVSISIDEPEDKIMQFLRTPHKACKYCNTRKRKNSYTDFAVSKGDINEWI